MKRTMTTDQQRLVVAYRGLADKVAMDLGTAYITGADERCVDMDDLKQESLEGMCQAAMRYDDSLNVAFTTLAYIWCRKYVLRAMRKCSTQLSVPDNFVEPVEVLRLNMTAAELDNVASDDDDGELDDRIYYELHQAAMNQACANAELHKRVQRLRTALTLQECQVIDHLFGLNSEPLSKKEIAQRMGISPSRVSQLLNSALQRMRDYEMK